MTFTFSRWIHDGCMEVCSVHDDVGDVGNDYDDGYDNDNDDENEAKLTTRDRLEN